MVDFRLPFGCNSPDLHASMFSMSLGLQLWLVASFPARRSSDLDCENCCPQRTLTQALSNVSTSFALQAKVADRVTLVDFFSQALRVISFRSASVALLSIFGSISCSNAMYGRLPFAIWLQQS